MSMLDLKNFNTSKRKKTEPESLPCPYCTTKMQQNKAAPSPIVLEIVPTMVLLAQILRLKQLHLLALQETPILLLLCQTLLIYSQPGSH